MKITRPVWMEVDLDKLKYNYEQIRKIVKPNSEIMAVIKANAYQHGAIEVAHTLIENEVTRFAIATLSEGIQLRKTFPNVDILILGYTPDYLLEDIAFYNITQTIYDIDQAKFLSAIGVKMKKQVKIHLKIETGMNRLGFKPTPKSISIIKEIYNLPNLFIEGIFTHFAVSDEIDKEFSYKQANVFHYVCKELEKEGVCIPIKHISNSAAILDLPDMNLDMVRAGILLYGIYPGPHTNHSLIDLKRVMSLKAMISHVKEIEPGEKIGYGLIYEAKEKRKIATLPLGYADGFSRFLTQKGEVIIKGKKVPMVGKLCMDQCMIDVTGLDVKKEEVVTIIGKFDDIEITLEDIGNKIGTIPADIMNMLNQRIPRVYLKENKIFKVIDYLLD